MREILFKAKRIDNGEWVEGCLVIDHSRSNLFEYRMQPVESGVLYAPPINPETLCQYTGLTDKNGNRIWENDILIAHLDESYPEDVTYETIEWGMSGWVTREAGSTDRQYLDEFDLEHYEVVGNIFDNKELLQEEHG
ncbi:MULTISPECIES: YopX family protein [unclassified Blautia]|uniref:YopX family protein n=1 Tax=unclassified Blautia TaxID=2648079 RepID=UPI001FD41DC6|nr:MULTISPECIES: YopX family protein [unclassified Blautia]MCJ7861193.1 YopX family protein [Blautia sp. NSJ-157]MCJ7864003.1 YopX family protein [Blautia sp. NSJ-140]